MVFKLSSGPFMQPVLDCSVHDRVPSNCKLEGLQVDSTESIYGKVWRRGPGSNRRIKVLQTSPLPLGYRALAGLPIEFVGRTQTAVANPACAGGRIGAGDEI